MPYYTTVAEARNFTGTATAEVSDTALNQLIRRATYEIDKRTARTWQRPVTETDLLYDGDGTDLLLLKHCDIQSLSAISIRETSGDSTATYTTVTATKVAVYSEGYLVLYTDAEVTAFTAGPNTAKLTYTRGATYKNAINATGGIDATTATITVDSTTGFPSYGTIIIEDEWIDYTGVSSTTFTGCVRGQYGTTGATHADDSVVYEAAPPDIRLICHLLLANYIDKDNERERKVDEMIKRIAWHNPSLA